MGKNWRALVLITGLAVSAMGVPAMVRAEIVKTAALDDPKCKGICFYWWPKLAIPAGWHQELPFSRKNNINFLVPDNEAINVGIYASALSTAKQAATLDSFIAGDQATFTKNNPGMVITEGEIIPTGDGQTLRTLVFVPAHGENWDVTAYGEETDKDGNHYYLTFTLSAPTKDQRDMYLPLLRQVIGAYHK